VAQDQNPSQGGYPRQGYNQTPDKSLLSHLAIEAGAGFNRPVGYARTFATWGGNVALGAGWKFNQWFSMLAEWQYLSDKIPGNYLPQVGVPGGHIHVWGLTLEPTFNYQTSGKLGGYAFGGGGFFQVAAAVLDACYPWGIEAPTTLKEPSADRTTTAPRFKHSISGFIARRLPAV
jgi:hypothetical protein